MIAAFETWWDKYQTPLSVLKPNVTRPQQPSLRC